MDKTGTVTKGVFTIKEIHPSANSEAEMMPYLLAMEAQSTHPIANAILEYKDAKPTLQATDVTEVAGKGLKGVVNGKQVLVGNASLLQS